VKARSGRPVRSVISVTAAVYVLCWLVGLFVAPSSPSPTAAAGPVAAYYAAQPVAVLGQSLLVHGIAGVCLVVLALTLPRRRWVVVSGGLAGVVSLTQVAFACLAVHAAAVGQDENCLRWFHVVNDADTLKLVLLAGFVAAATFAGSSRWLRTLGVVLVPLLVLGGLAFLVDSGVLAALLTVSLPMLLLWAASLAVLQRPLALTGSR
jgi:hypothetical protein